MNDEEKIEEVLRIVNKSLDDGEGNNPDKKTKIVWLQDDMKAIKKILESVDFGFDGGLDTRLRKLH